MHYSEPTARLEDIEARNFILHSGRLHHYFILANSLSQLNLDQVNKQRKRLLSESY